MVKKYFLIAVLALSNVPESHAFRAGFWANSVKNIGNRVFPKFFDKVKSHSAQEKFNKYESVPYDLPCLNQCPRAKPILKELLETYSPHKKEIHFYQKKHLDHKLLDGTHSIHASSVKDSYIIIHSQSGVDALLHTFHPNHHRARGTMGHEIGHIVNNHVRNYVFAFSFIDTLIPSNSFIPRMLKIVMLRAYSRRQEREADYHVIRHAKDPFDLRGLASMFKSLEQEEMFMQKTWLDNLLRTHPSPAKRAAYFEKAAEKLEAKQIRENLSPR